MGAGSCSIDRTSQSARQRPWAMVDYNAEPHPVAFKRGELDAETLHVMSTSLQRDEAGEVTRPYFYSDGCVPTAGAAQMEA